MSVKPAKTAASMWWKYSLIYSEDVYIALLFCRWDFSINKYE